jgi:hypothetical protein
MIDFYFCYFHLQYYFWIGAKYGTLHVAVGKFHLIAICNRTVVPDLNVVTKSEYWVQN